MKKAVDRMDTGERGTVGKQEIFSARGIEAKYYDDINVLHIGTYSGKKTGQIVLDESGIEFLKIVLRELKL